MSEDTKKAFFEFIMVIAFIVISFVLFTKRAHAQENTLKTRNLSSIILESNTPHSADNSDFNSNRGISKKLDWVSDVMTDKNDIFIQSSNYDSVEDDQGYGRRMLRRAVGKQASITAQTSELDYVYNSASRLLKSASEIMSVDEDIGPPLRSKHSSSTQGTKNKILTFGFDGSNQFNPTFTLYQKVKFCIEPFSNRAISEISWDF